MIGLGDWGGKNHRNRIANKTVERRFVFERNRQHGFEVFIQQGGDVGGVIFFHQRGKSRQIGKHKAAFLALAAQMQLFGVVD